MTPDLRIGSSGWSYPTGLGTWNGVFYPPTRGRAKGFDELAFYAAHFDTVEVNSTFYGQPRADVCRHWAERTPPGFEFSVKLYQKFTHPKMYRARLTASLPELSGEPSGSDLVAALAAPNQADLDAFRRGVEPLAMAGKLGAVLAQFPPSFKKAPAARDYIAELLRALADYKLAVELRHRSWSDSLDETVSLLNEFQAAWVQIDEPQFTSSIKQNALPNVEGFYYMRLHGRNAETWWRHDRAEDRYNYLYSAEELKQFSGTVDAVRRLVKKVYLYTNNHFSAKAIANAAMLKHQLGEPVEGEYPPAFLEHYPELAGIVRIGAPDNAPGPARVVIPSRTSG